MKQNRIRCAPTGEYVYYKKCRKECPYYEHCLTIQTKENRLIRYKKHFNYFIKMLAIRLTK